MLPVFLDLKILKIYTFGVFLVLALFWGLFLLWRNFLLTSYKEEDVFDCVFVSLAGALFFGRLVYVILNFKDFGLNLFKFILVNGYPGISLLGFIGGAIVTLYLYFSYKKIKFDDAIDYFVPSFFLALGFGKLGSFFSGFEIGSKTKFLLSLRYPGISGLRHLTAFYEAILFFIATYISLRIMFAQRRGSLTKGFNLYFFLWYLGLVLFVLDPLKAKHQMFFGLPFNAVISAVLLLTFSFYFLYYFRNSISGKLALFRNLVPKNGFSKDRSKKIQGKITKGEGRQSTAN